MRRILNQSAVILFFGFAGLLISSGLKPVSADATNAPSLVISRFKITSSNGQFVTLYNSTDSSLDMSKYQLAYFNNYDLSKASSSRLIALSGILPPHGYYSLNDDNMTLCYQMIVDSVSLDFSSTAGMVQVFGLTQSSPGQAALPILQDYVGWSKTATAGAQILPSNIAASLKRQPVSPVGDPLVSASGSGTWQQVLPDPNNPCELVSALNQTVSVPSGGQLSLLDYEVPANIMYVSATGNEQIKSIPLADIGLLSPKITELLPNPTGSGNDASDEFIELYNPNNKEFDLSGFVLQTGLTRLYNYTFPVGTKLKPKSFTAFYSEDTSLTLSNTSSQAKLIDPLGAVIGSADLYKSAKDGQVWALAKNKWQWSTAITPGKTNIIKVPTSKAAAKTKKTGNTKVTKASSAAANTQAPAAAATGNNPDAGSPVHYWTLALVATGVILYGLYEYRNDLGNKFRQFRRYFKIGRSSRSEA